MKPFIARCMCIVGALLLAGCAATRMTTRDIQQDSVSVVVREVTKYVVDTVEVAIPYISETVSTRDTISYLENDYARSEAIISGGMLHHNLETIPQLRQIQIKTPRLHRDSIMYKHINHDVEIEVEKDLTFIQKCQIEGFWLLLLVAALLSIYCFAPNRR